MWVSPRDSGAACAPPSKSTYEENCFGIAKGAAYSSLLAFFPVITTIAAVLVQANADAVARTIARLLYDVIPPGTEDVVRDAVYGQGQPSHHAC